MSAQPAPPPAAKPAGSRAAAFFDLDKTIIATSSATAFSRPFLADGLITRRAMLGTAYAHFLYMLGGADEQQTERMRRQLAAVSKGWEVEQVSAIVGQTLHEYIRPAVYAEALELIEEHRAAGRDVVIVSASGAEVVQPIAAMLGADHAIATRMAIADGRYTGEIEFYAYGENKATAIGQLAAERGYDLAASFAYSDSITDAPMLAAVGNAAVVNPDRALRRLAAERGWQVLRFTRPVTLGRRVPPAAPWAALAAAAAITALVWWAARRHGDSPLARGRRRE